MMFTSHFIAKICRVPRVRMIVLLIDLVSFCVHIPFVHYVHIMYIDINKLTTYLRMTVKVQKYKTCTLHYN